jgi:hypothetical protein
MLDNLLGELRVEVQRDNDVSGHAGTVETLCQN